MNGPTLQDRAERLRNTRFLGVPIDDFERAGREQLVFLLLHGLTPDSKVVDIGCGALRAGYWLIHFLKPGHYFGIEPSAERLAIGTSVIVDPDVIAAKRPRFDGNGDFDSSVFGERFDFFLAYSIWTHASKRQIGVMLDNFLRDSADGAVLLATFQPAGRGGGPDYQGDEWVGTSHTSRSAGCIFHSYGWVEEQCSRRGLSIQCVGRDSTHGQTWLRIARAGRAPRLKDLTFLPPTLSLFARLIIRRLAVAMGLRRSAAHPLPPSRPGGIAMSNQNNRGGDDAASSNTPAEPDRKHESGGNMGAGKSGGKSFGAEKPEVRDDHGSREAGRDWD